MKKILGLIIIILWATYSFAQLPSYPNNTSEGSDLTKKTFGVTNGAIKAHVQLRWYPDTGSANVMPYLKFTPDIQIKAGEVVYVRSHDATVWQSLGGSASANITLPFVTSLPVLGQVVGTNISADSAIRALFGQAQPPLATLTGGVIYEYTSAAIFGATLNWSASRQSATTPLSTIVVAGVNQAFSQPSAPGTVSGTQGVTVTSNIVVTYNNVVTASNGQNITVSTVFTPRNKYYIGYVATSTPTDNEIIGALGGTVGGTFATTQVTSGVLPAPASESYIVFAYPSAFGTATIKIQGLAVGYFLTTRSFVNASGYSVSYNIYISPFSTNGGVEYQVL